MAVGDMVSLRPDGLLRRSVEGDRIFGQVTEVRVSTNRGAPVFAAISLAERWIQRDDELPWYLPSPLAVTEADQWAATQKLAAAAGISLGQAARQILEAVQRLAEPFAVVAQRFDEAYPKESTLFGLLDNQGLLAQPGDQQQYDEPWEQYEPWKTEAPAWADDMPRPARDGWSPPKDTTRFRSTTEGKRRNDRARAGSSRMRVVKNRG